MKEERGYVYIYRKNGFPIDYREAVDLYQLAGRNSKRVSVYGAGEDGGFCFMLGSRFLPEEIRIAPLLFGGTADAFLRCVKKTTPFPFFITAPITFYLPNEIDETSLKKLIRMINRTSSFQKRFEFYENDHSVTEMFCNSMRN